MVEKGALNMENRYEKRSWKKTEEVGCCTQS